MNGFKLQFQNLQYRIFVISFIINVVTMVTVTLPLLLVLLGFFICRADDDCTKKSSLLAPVRLKTDLLCDYDKTMRPVVNHTNFTTVRIRMVLKFFTYEMHSNTLSVHNWLALIWQDEHLTWDPTKYENLKQIHLSSSEIWLPDLSVYNRNDQSGSPNAMGTDVDCLVLDVGTVVCIAPNRHDALCMPDLSKFPYDNQNCSLRFGSWVHSGEEINFQLFKQPVTVDDYIPNGEWKLLKVETQLYPGHFNCCPNSTYPSVGFNFIIERHSATESATIIIPAFTLIVLTLTTLWMNPKNWDRICLAFCNMIIHFTYLQTLSWQLPSTGDNPPLLILYAKDSLLLCCFSLFLTIILKGMVLSENASPAWISTVVSIILKNKPGQIFLLYNTNLRNVASAKGDEDSSVIIPDSAEPIVSQDWILFARLLDRLSFIAFFITYFRMFVCFLL